MESENSPDKAAAPRKKETILIVDDSEGDRKLMAMALSEQGYSVVEAGDGTQGLEVFRKHVGKIDLILTDILMPGMDGVEFIQHVRTIEPKIKVLFISGYKRQFDQEIGGQKVDFMEKSNDLSDLVKKVNWILAPGLFKKWMNKILVVGGKMAE